MQQKEYSIFFGTLNSASMFAVKAISAFTAANLDTPRHLQILIIPLYLYSNKTREINGIVI